jgi:hypothetical protein
LFFLVLQTLDLVTFVFLLWSFICLFNYFMVDCISLSFWWIVISFIILLIYGIVKCLIIDRQVFREWFFFFYFSLFLILYSLNWHPFHSFGSLQLWILLELFQFMYLIMLFFLNFIWYFNLLNLNLILNLYRFFSIHYLPKDKLFLTFLNLINNNHMCNYLHNNFYFIFLYRYSLKLLTIHLIIILILLNVFVLHLHWNLSKPL